MELGEKCKMEPLVIATGEDHVAAVTVEGWTMRMLLRRVRIRSKIALNGSRAPLVRAYGE